MIIKSFAQIILLVVTLANSQLLHSGAITGWTEQQTRTAAHLPAATPAIAMPAVVYTPLASPRAQQAATLSARAALSYDLVSGQVLYQKNSDAKLPIASLTKLVTAIVIAQRHAASEMITVPQLPAIDSSLTVIGIKAGERFTVGQLLSAAMISSAADAATALAIWDSGSQDAFVGKMNDFATNWDLSQTHFAGPVGLDNPANYSSARDLVRITEIALHNPIISAAVASRSQIITDQAGQKFNLTTTDQLLGDGKFYGVKTGTTADAGQCFVGFYRDSTRQLITVVLGSTDRFADTLNLTSTTLGDYQWL